MDIVVPGLTNTVATAINTNGDIVGYGTGTNGMVGFLDLASPVFLRSHFGNISILAFPGAISTRASGINDAGYVVGTYRDDAGPHGFVYYQGNYTTLDAPAPAPPNTTMLTAINNVGQIAGTAAGPTAFSTDGFVDTAGTFAFVPIKPLQFIGVNGLNDYGEIAGSDGMAESSTSPAWGTVNSFSDNHSFTGGSFTAVNNSGLVILFINNVSYLQFSASQTSLGTPISAPDSSQTMATGINTAGTVVGSYTNSTGSHAFTATTTAPPSCTVTGAGGQFRQLTFTMQDPSGLEEISVLKATNISVNVPSFPPGTTSPVEVSVGTQNAFLTLSATNTSGASTICSGRMTPGLPQWFGYGGVLISNIVVGTDRDGSLEAFGLGTDNAMWHITQSGLAGNWGSWTSLGGASFVGDPAVVLDSSGQLELLEISSDGTLWNISQTAPGNWWGATWHSIASGVKGRPAVVNNADGLLQAFVRTSVDSIETLTQSSPGSVWPVSSLLGGVVISDPAAAVDANGVAQVFAIGTDRALWNTGITSQGVVYSWSSLGGSLKGDPTVISRSGLLYAFSRATDDSLAYDYQSSASAWNGWQDAGGVLVSNATAAVNSDGRIEVFVVGTDFAVWRNAQVTADNNNFYSSNWGSLGGYINGDIFPILDQTSVLNLFVIGGDYGLWNMWQSVPSYWF